MIIPRYSAFRRTFALVGAPMDPDGYPQFPGIAKLRTGGFSNTLKIQSGLSHNVGDLRLLSIVDGFASTIPQPFAFPLTITCNDYAADAVTGTHEFDWFLSQRVDDDRSTAVQPGFAQGKRYFSTFLLSLTQSGTIRIDIQLSNVARLLNNFDPETDGLDTLSADDLKTLFKHVHLYVQRRSDKAYQWTRIYA